MAWVLSMLALTLQAQDPEKSYFLELPPGYKVPSSDSLIEEQIVEAATFEESIAPASNLLFDTINAVEVGEIILDGQYIPTVSNELIKDRLSCIEGEIPLTFHPQVRNYVDKFTVTNRKFALSMLRKKNLYFPLYERIFDEYGIPDEMKYLSIIESGLNPRVRSRAAAVGLWQFMAVTGRHMGLRQNYYLDERQDPEKATRAAAKYLKQLYNYFDQDWELALAAYNCGPGNVRKAMRRSGKTSYWEIYDYLPRETRDYLPSFVAMMYTINYAEDHNLLPEEILYPIETEEVFINQHLDLEAFAEQIKVCVDDLKDINPELKLDYVPSNAYNYALKIPANRLAYFLENQDSILKSSRKTNYTSQLRKPTPTKSVSPSKSSNSSSESSNTVNIPIRHRVQSGETLGGIAQQYRTYVSQIKRWNGLRNHFIYPGQNLIVGYKTQAARATPTSSKYHTVRRGESLGIIANKYGVTIENLMEWNSLKSNSIHPNWRLAVAPPEEKAKKTEAIPPYHTVAKGEGLAMIAKKYGLTVAQIQEWNDLRGTHIYPDDRLRLRPTSSKPEEKPVPPKVHVVLRNETLSQIAENHKLTVDEIKKWNNIASADEIYPGQKLALEAPAGEQAKSLVPDTKPAKSSPPKPEPKTHHAVKEGETLSAISKIYGVSVADLRTWNALEDDKIRRGDSLRIAKPEGDTTPAQPATSPTAASNKTWHLVRKGESLSLIATLYKKTTLQLKQWNNLKDDQIRIGQKLYLSQEAAEAARLAAMPATHTVRQGESLYSIAQQYQLSLADLKKWNNFSDNPSIRPGQEIRLKPEPQQEAKESAMPASSSEPRTKVTPLHHTVAKGETLLGIARQYDLNWKDLKTWNLLENDEVKEGQELVLKSYLAKQPKKEEASPTPKPSDNASNSYHIVRSGESLNLIAAKYQLSVAQLKKANGLKSDQIHPRQKLKISGDELDKIEEGVTIRESNGDIYHMVQRNESLNLIAYKYNVSVADIKRLNNLSSDQIHPFQKLLVRTQQAEQKAKPDPNFKPRKYHTVENGDSLWEIARKYDTTVEAIKRLNGMGSNSIRPGQQIRVQ